MNKRFYYILSGFAVLIFVLNINHLNQQLIFSNLFLDGAYNLLSGNGYTNSVFQGQPAFYPMWGYSFLLIPDALFNTGGYLILLIQLIMTIIGIRYFYKLFNVEENNYHLIFHLPFIAIMSVKWPDAIIAFLIIIFFFYFKSYILNANKRTLIVTCIILGLVINFRTEFLYFPFFFLLLQLVPFNFQQKRNLLVATIAFAVTVIIFISPWAIRSYIHTGKVNFTTTNNGMVSYISLGSIADNPWNIYISDKTAWDYARANGEENPFSEKGNKLLNDAFGKAISEHPLSFATKCGYNFTRCFTGGVYTGEYANILVDTTYRYKLNEELKSKGNSINQFFALFDFEPGVYIPIVIEKILQAAFIPVNLIFLITLFYLLFKFKKIRQKEMFSIILVFVAYKIFITSFFIYEPRFLNSVYYFAFGIFLTEKLILPNLKEIIKNKRSLYKVK